MRLLGLAVVLLATMAGLLVYTAGQEAQAFDEATHIVAGESYWRTGDYKINVEHPPLAKLIGTLLLRGMGLRFETTNPHWVHPNQIALGQEFLYQNKRDADDILFWSRVPMMGLTLLLGLGILFWTWARFGKLAAAVALLLFALDSNFIAHGHYVATDVPVTCFGFFAVVAWIAWLENGRKRHLVVAALTLGLAMAAKYSALYLLPVHAMLLLVQVVRRKCDPAQAAKALLIVVIGGAAICSIFYGPQTMAWLKGEFSTHAYEQGLQALLAHDNEGHPTYFLGKVSKGGNWQYFPVAFLVKTPTAALVLFFGALLALPFLWRRNEGLRKDGFVYAALLAYPAVYFAMSIQGNINIGVRHLLPIYPFLFAFAGAIAARLPKHLGLAAALFAAATMGAEAARVHPHHLAFFNTFAGGPENGHKYLLDSNLDWGQDVIKLKRYMDENGIDYVHIAYFGMADLKYYGIEHGSLCGPNPDEIRRLDGWVVASATNVYDVYFDRETFGWVRRFQPVAKIGWSLYAYDLRQSTIPADKRPLPPAAP